MAQLSDTQLVILNAACKRDSGLVLPLPDRLKGGAANKVVASLVGKGMVEEVDAKRGEPVWRATGDGHGATLVITAAGYAALGVEPPAATQAATSAPTPLPQHQPGRRVPPATPASVAADAGGGNPKGRAGSKQAAVVELLSRPEGATLDDIATATGWQRHTIRGAIAGAIKKKLGLEVTTSAEEGRGRVYRIQAAETGASA